MEAKRSGSQYHHPWYSNVFTAKSILFTAASACSRLASPVESLVCLPCSIQYVTDIKCTSWTFDYYLCTSANISIYPL